MSSRRPTRHSEAAAPAFPPGTLLAKIKRLPVSIIQLYLNQHHLAQDGTKNAKAKRLYDFLQTQPDPDNSSSDNNSDQESGSSSSSGSSDAGDPANNTRAPFNKAQQKALTDTIKSA